MNSASAASSQYLPDETVQVIAPVPNAIFERRSSRLRLLAAGHVIGEYLDAIAHLADAQVAASQALSAETEPQSVPNFTFNLRDPGHGETWQRALQIIISEMELTRLPDQSQAALSRLRSSTPADLESSAKAILDGNYDSIDLAAFTFLAAALQVYWTNMASRIKAKQAEHVSYVCPVCGSPPVAGIIQSDRKLRYLCCSLCATLWYVPRLTCTRCGLTENLSYFTVDGDRTDTKAEACSQCNTYLKLFYLESNPGAEPFADDLATISLDLLMAYRSFSRNGINLFLVGK